MRNLLVKSALVATAALTVVLGTTACATTEPAEPKSESSILTRELPADVSAKGVVLAGVLLGSSDIEVSVVEGLVTPAEVAEAQQAIEDGTLDQWVERAESEK